MDNQGRQFLEQMQLDLNIETQINESLKKETPTAKVVRQFVIEVKGF